MNPYRKSARVEEAPPLDEKHPETLHTWTSARHCPLCDVPLFAARRHHIRIDACGTCGGAWVPNDVARRMLATWAGASVAAELAAIADAHATRPQRVGLAERCPDCEGPLERARVEDVEIDLCRKHGTWFDRRELGTIVARVVPDLEAEADPVLPEGMRAVADDGNLAIALFLASGPFR